MWLVTFNFIFALIIGAIIPIIIWFVVLLLIQRRLAAFTEQLGDSLITISNALRAGYSFQQTIEVIAKEMEPPISEEFSHINNEIFMGVPLEEALRTSNKRIGSADFELVVTAVLIQREVGGNLAQVLDNISYTIMERIRMKREILALTAQGRFSAFVLLMLPFAAGVAMFFMNHDNFMMLFEEPLGQMALAVSAVMEVIGYLVIRRIVDIDV
jgi:tight adherence protein B